ncbi:signal peptidase I [Pseudodesulfovibrio sp. F-1]|uniref:Signal peptidase I n=1 Tax=Pseudodesulfovibrio alkaliphilus TaxID=2661613 RepID=A0A7K1KJS6_9BACT|nr:signal peptidase I [Pseudodesulfovibrio alkaliphilus]MUM76324.1 signal peptidase I [Pseudodesulfovibrio alkaliphilus]
MSHDSAPCNSDPQTVRPTPAEDGSGNSLPRRRPWLAALLSLIATGVGQLYNGQWRKGLAFFVAEVAMGAALLRSMGTFAGLATAMAGLIALNLLAATEAYRSARRGGLPLTRLNRWWIYVLAVLASSTVGVAGERLVKSRFYQNFQVPSGSMEPTLLVGDRFMSVRLAPDAPLRRSDVVVFIEETSGQHFVKRVVALPGETVHIAERQVFVDDRALNEPYTRHVGRSMLPGRDRFGPLHLGPDQYFLLGDNRERSHDSRWLGPIPRDRIVTRALYIYLPGAPGDRGWTARLGESIR